LFTTEAERLSCSGIRILDSRIHSRIQHSVYHLQ
jgi:hypothetical protein